MSQYNIRIAQEADVELLSQISGDWFRAQFDGTCTLDDMDSFVQHCFSQDAILEELRDRSNEIYLLQDKKNQTLAYVRMKPGRPENLDTVLTEIPMEIKRFYVDPKHKGTGIADELMNYVLDRIAHLRFATVILSVWEYNVRAQQFYKRYGFGDTHIRNLFPIGQTPQWDKWYLKWM